MSDDHENVDGSPEKISQETGEHEQIQIKVDYEGGDERGEQRSVSPERAVFDPVERMKEAQEERAFLSDSLRNFDRLKLNKLKSRMSVSIKSDDGLKTSQVKLEKIDRMKMRFTPTEIQLRDLSQHKSPTEYVCPEFEIEKFNPRTKMKLLKKTRLFQVNLYENRFSNLRRDFVEQKSIHFNDVEGIVKESKNRIGLMVKGKKLPRRLIFKSKKDVTKFYELCHLTVPGKVCWIPEFIPVDHDPCEIKEISLQGEISVKKNVEKEVVTEAKRISGTRILAGSQFEEVMVYCVTWNVGVCSLPEVDLFFQKAIRFGEEFDMYVICVQQQLGHSHPISSQKKVGSYFDKQFTDNGYMKLATEITQGVGMFVFVKESLRKKIVDVRTNRKTVKSLYSCVCVQMKYNDSPVSFVGVTIVPQHFLKKAQALDQIFDDDTLEDSHHIYILGDFNTTVALPPSIALSFINKREDLGQVVVGFDQLKILQEKLGRLQLFREGSIEFLPTYPVKYHTHETLAAAEKETSIKRELNYQYVEGINLSYSGRVLIRSLPGLQSEVKVYEAGDVVSGRYRHLPVYSIIRMDTQRCHISHFSSPEPRKILRILGLYVGGICTIPEMKDPQLRIEADWLEKEKMYTKRSKTRPTANPKFMRKEIPVLKPLKDSKSFLSSAFIKFVLFDKSLPKSHCVKGTAMVDLKNLVMEAVEGKKLNGSWFSSPIVFGTAVLGDMIGFITMIERKEGEEGDEGDDDIFGGEGEEEVEGEENHEIKDIVKGFEGM